MKTMPPPDAPVRPCPWMKQLLSALADGTLSGIARRYAESHVAQCGPCSHALRALVLLRERLQRLSVATPPSAVLAPERRAALDAALGRLDREDGGGGPP